MRDYGRIDGYLTSLAEDIYPQPEDKEHTAFSLKAVRMCMLRADPKSVLDIGAGQGMCEGMFKRYGVKYTGVALGADVAKAQVLGRNVIEMDFHFLDYPDDSFDLVFARHVLEHSPMPLLALMEWHRVSKRNLMLVLPNPDHYGYIGRNHYSVMERHQARWLLRRAGWRIIKKEYTDTEYRFLCAKMPILGYEGWATSPLPHSVYAEDRDE
jgi:ubiquinone/menaquinone biosynthesis C-methylase UbiE